MVLNGGNSQVRIVSTDILWYGEATVVVVEWGSGSSHASLLCWETDFFSFLPDPGPGGVRVRRSLL